MKRFSLLSILFIWIAIFQIQPASAGQYCADGWYSQSSGSGSCSWHGGIAGGSSSKSNKYKAPAPAYKAPAPAYKAPAPAYKAPSSIYPTPSKSKSGITGFCSVLDRNKGRC
jgi:hypothetical protein